MRNRKSAFTLIELLVVIVIIAVLASLLFPAFRAAMASRDEAAALSDMHQLGAAFLLYAGENSYMLPSRAEAQPGPPKQKRT